MAGTTSRGVVRTGARGVAVGTAAIAILGVLQQAIGAFDPRPSMSAAIVAAVAFASFVTKRLGDRRREDREAAELRRQLVVWPPRPLSDVDPVHLGAFPARRSLGPIFPYVPRTLDAELRDALTPGSFVLLHGPPLAGKTRTACAVASRGAPRRTCHRPAQRRRARRAARARFHVRRRRGTRGVAGRPRPLRGDARPGDPRRDRSARRAGGDRALAHRRRPPSSRRSAPKTGTRCAPRAGPRD